MRIRKNLRGWRLGVAALLLTGLALAAGVSGAGADEPGGDWSAVFTLTNDPEGNELAVYSRDNRGRLGTADFIPTGGNGTGGGLGNQGALALSDNKQFLYAVNPGSNTITVFRLTRRGPQVLQVIESKGKRPISLTVHRNLLYVLNARGAVQDMDGIAGFEIRPNGRLVYLAGSAQLLSAASTAPAQVGFNRAGNVLIVTEKSTNKIAAFAINRRGLADGRAFADSVGQTPFGFEFSRDGFLVVSEAFGGAADASAVSSYWLNNDEGTLEVISESIPTTESAACWIAITQNAEYAYTTNTASATVTGYKLSNKGKLTILDIDGVTAETGTSPTDMTILGNRTLFVLNRDDGSVGVFDIMRGGALDPIQVIGGLPLTNPTGLIVR